MEAKFEVGKGLIVNAPENDPEAFMFELLHTGYFKKSRSLVLSCQRADGTVSALYIGDKVPCMGLTAYLQHMVCEQFIHGDDEEAEPA